MKVKSAATQLDVARAAGVSTASVSRVLNGIGPINASIRSRVESAIAALGYVPNDGARALVTRRSMVLGAIIPTLNNAIFAEGINAFEAEARRHGYTLVLSVSNYDLDDERVLVGRMVQRGVDGLLLVGNEHLPASFQVLRRAAIPHVCSWTFDDDPPAANVGFRNAAAMTEIVDLLVALGHRRIAMLAGITLGNDRALSRVEAVRLRLAGHGLALVPGLLIECPYTIRDARDAFCVLWDRAAPGARPTAVICGNDVIAVGALLEARRRGIALPGSLSITGFDNLAISAEIDPAITTVDVPAEAMGREAAAALIRAIDDGSPVESRLLSTRLIVRDTTGGPPQDHRRTTPVPAATAAQGGCAATAVQDEGAATAAQGEGAATAAQGGCNGC